MSIEPSYPALDKLPERLRVNGVAADPLRVASALLGIIQTTEWLNDPLSFHRWVEQLAMDVALAWADKDRRVSPPMKQEVTVQSIE